MNRRTLLLATLAAAAAAKGRGAAAALPTFSVPDGLKDLPFGVPQGQIKHVSAPHLKEGLFILTDADQKPIYELPIRIDPKNFDSESVKITADWLAVMVFPKVAQIIIELPTRPLPGGIPQLFPTELQLKGIERWLPTPPFLSPERQNQIESARSRILTLDQKGEYIGEADKVNDRSRLASLFMDYLNRSCDSDTRIGEFIRKGRPSVQERALAARYEVTKDPKIARVLNTLYVRDWLCMSLSRGDGSRVINQLMPPAATPDIARDTLFFAYQEPFFWVQDLHVDAARCMGYRISYTPYINLRDGLTIAVHDLKQSDRDTITISEKVIETGSISEKVEKLGNFSFFDAESRKRLRAK